MPDHGDTPDVILRRVLAAARRRYALEAQQDPRCFDYDAATELIFCMTGPAPQATAQWLRTLADIIAVERSGGDSACQAAAYEEACVLLHATLTTPATSN